MKLGKRSLIVALLCITLIFSGVLYAFAGAEGGDVTGDEYYLTETEPSTGGGIGIMTMQGFTFSGNVPASPNYVKSSEKILPTSTNFRVYLNSSTGSKPVKMRLMNINGTALSTWKSVSVGSTVSLYTSGTNAQKVYVQLQSSTTSSMTASGTWYF